jgi:Raf kinase inhibitor-like YbhB/YbcL family protein
MRLSSPSFEPEHEIPRRYTCEGEEIPPALQWSDVPEGTRSLALIVDDPDAPDPRAPRMTWVHWLVWDLPPNLRGLPEGGPSLPVGVHQGRNDARQVGYQGPCPPIGRHRYFFHLFALDRELQLHDGASRKQLEAAMKGHVLAKAELMGTYAK